MDIDPERLTRSPFVIGALGAIVALRYVPGESWRERAFNVATGSLTAGYVAPALVEWLRVDTQGLAGAAAFGIGLLGMSLIAALVQGIKSLQVAEIITSWLKRKD